MKNLYRVHTRCLYTDEHKARWNARDYDSTYLMWREQDASGVMDELVQRQKDDSMHFKRHYRHEAQRVVHVSDEELAAMRSALAGQGCCELAVQAQCVCRLSTLCPEHGRICRGSHD